MKGLFLPEHQATMRWFELGQGAPVVFLPGLSLSVVSSFWEIVTAPELSGRRQILVDFLGAGQSETPKRFAYDLAGHAQTVLHLLEHLDCGPVDLVGHSMGGTVAIEMAAQRPDLVRRLVVAESNLLPGGGAASRRVTRDTEADFLNGGHEALMGRLADRARCGDEEADRVLAAWQQADPRGLYRNAAALVTLDAGVLDRFLALPMPRAFVFGEVTLQSEPAPDAPDPSVLKAGGVATHIVPKAGHNMMQDNPAGFLSVLLQALAV